MPAGSNKIDWSPKEEKVVKTASTAKPEVKKEEVKEEVNALYEAAKTVIEAAKKCEKCGKKPCECKEEKEDKAEKKEEKKAGEEVKEKKEGGKVPGVPDGTGPGKDSNECPFNKDNKDSAMKDDEKEEIKVEVPEGGETITEPVAEEKEEVSKMEQAVNKIDEAVIELKEVVQEEKGETGPVDEVEIEIEDDGVPGEEVSDSEIIVQSEPDGMGMGMDKGMDKGMDGCGCLAGKGKKGVEKVAAVEEEFCKFAKLSTSNKKKLADYWTNMLGYPKDWVDLLTKDYEK